MAATAEHLSDEVPRAHEDDLPRRVHGVVKSWLHAELQNWGDWRWERRDYQGFPSRSSLAAFQEGGRGGVAGHRVLCLDMPPKVLCTHLRWLQLPENEAAAIEAEYVVGSKADGTLWSRAEKCAALGITERAYRDRLQRARCRLLGLEPV